MSQVSFFCLLRVGGGDQSDDRNVRFIRRLNSRRVVSFHIFIILLAAA